MNNRFGLNRNPLFLGILFIPFYLCCLSVTGQQNPAINASVQIRQNYVYSLGFGYQPKNPIIKNSRAGKYTFNGWIANFLVVENIENLGFSLQRVLYANGFGFGIEGNFVKFESENHVSIKPLLGLSFPMFKILYGYNYDLSKNVDFKFDQHEIIFVLLFPIGK